MTSRSRGRALIEDVNNKVGQHTAKNEAWREAGVKVVRNKLPYGDYCLPPAKVVDTKRDILELCMDLKQDHERFRNAAIKAMECGSHMVILVENEDGVRSLEDLERWTEPDRSFKNRQKRNQRAVRYDGASIAKSCRTMSERYGLEFDFCSPDDAASTVSRHLGVML